MRLARNILLGLVGAALLAGLLVVHVNSLFKAELSIKANLLRNWHDDGEWVSARERTDMARYLEPCDLVVPHEGTNVFLVMKTRDAENQRFADRPLVQIQKYERPGFLGIDAAGQVWWYSCSRHAVTPFGYQKVVPAVVTGSPVTN